MTNFTIDIFFNRTIHVIKYLHAEDGNWTARGDRCGHNCQNKALPRDQRLVSAESCLLLIRETNGLITRVMQPKERHLESISKCTPLPFPEGK